MQFFGRVTFIIDLGKIIKRKKVLTTSRNSFLVKIIVVLGEFFLLNFLLGILSTHFKVAFPISDAKILMYAIVNLAYMVGVSQVGIILDKRSAPVESILTRVSKTVLIFVVLLLIVVCCVKVYLPLSFLVFFFLIFFLAASSWRLLCRAVLKLYREHGGNKKKVIVLGAGQVAGEVYNKLISNIAYGYNFCGFYDDRLPEAYKVDASLVKGNLNDALEVIKKGEVAEVICALPSGDDRAVVPLLKQAESKFIRCYIVPDFKRFIKKKVSLQFMENLPLVDFREEPLENLSNRIVKRVFDLCFSLGFLITLFPIIFICCAVAIKCSSPGPIFFKQKRTGKSGKDFYCWKFRTMKVNNDADKVQATKGDSRITPVGAFLRKTNLDEMPQFINVLFGDMSIVGPRPHMVSQTDTYSKLIEDYMVRHLAKPGITGWAQVTGFRGETSEISQMEGRVERDVWYIENWSFWLDIKIIFLTVYNMIKGDEAAY